MCRYIILYTDPRKCRPYPPCLNNSEAPHVHLPRRVVGLPSASERFASPLSAQTLQSPMTGSKNGIGFTTMTYLCTCTVYICIYIYLLYIYYIYISIYMYESYIWCALIWFRFGITTLDATPCTMLRSAISVASTQVAKGPTLQCNPLGYILNLNRYHTKLVIFRTPRFIS